MIIAILIMESLILLYLFKNFNNKYLIIILLHLQSSKLIFQNARIKHLLYE